jgi:hypothetical protein
MLLLYTVLAWALVAWSNTYTCGLSKNKNAACTFLSFLNTKLHTTLLPTSKLLHTNIKYNHQYQSSLITTTCYAVYHTYKGKLNAKTNVELEPLRNFKGYNSISISYIRNFKISAASL